ncbi:hypothetical protein VE03_04397 [Pseudogymnoascus sp. 23342-1-I1]|nr:hypothetical protein VE03_04397 [Pseudogymnoascus sp. 23342-1-I1]
MSTNPGGGPRRGARTSRHTTRPVPIPAAPATDRSAAMSALRAHRDPATAAVNAHFAHTGQLPRIAGATPLPRAVPAGIGSSPANRARGRGQPGRHWTRPRKPKELAPPPIGGLPKGTKIIQPGRGPQQNLPRYGVVPQRAPVPLAMPAQRPGVPPPSYADIRQRMGMQTAQGGVMKYPIRYLGLLPDVVSEEFDASTGYNPPPMGRRGTDEEEARWEAVREGSLRGVILGEWNASWLMRMAQLKGVEVPEGEGEAAVREELRRALREVQKVGRTVAQKAAVEGTDGGRWSRLAVTEGGRVEKHLQGYIEIDEGRDELEAIKAKVVAKMVNSGCEIKVDEVSLWLSAVTWGNKPSRMVRWAGRNAEIDDGYWLGIYVYRMTEEGKKAERERSEKFKRESKAVAGRAVAGRAVERTGR